jgi:ribosome biogenesis GTPase
MPTGIIMKAISGFYYVEAGTSKLGETIKCKARGRFRRDNVTPLVGDTAEISVTEDGKGVLEAVLPRKNAFVRPPIANLDQMVIIASAVIPVTDPFLIDRMTAIAAQNGCGVVVVINKLDLDRGDELYDIYRSAGFTTIRTSAETGEGIAALSESIRGKVSAFTGNSGVGKSSILNMLEPGFNISVGDVSQKLGRGRHTTRHVELYRLKSGAVVADTPGFSSFDAEEMELSGKERLQHLFIDFGPYIGRCRFRDCAHVREAGCAVLEAVERGAIMKSRHASYVRLYEQSLLVKDWEIKKRDI